MHGLQASAEGVVRRPRAAVLILWVGGFSSVFEPNVWVQSKKEVLWGSSLQSFPAALAYRALEQWRGGSARRSGVARQAGAAQLRGRASNRCQSERPRLGVSGGVASAERSLRSWTALALGRIFQGVRSKRELPRVSLRGSRGAPGLRPPAASAAGGASAGSERRARP